MSDPINLPSDVVKARAQTIGEQLASVVSDALLNGLAQSLGKLLADRTLEPGPWLLTADGTVTGAGAGTPEVCGAFELLRQHTIDWGRCDHPDDCECSDGRARRLLDLCDTDSGAVAEHPGGTITALILTHFFDMRDDLNEIAQDDNVDAHTRNVARDRVRLADRLLNGEQP